jgi:hypothetical protein
MVKGGGPETDRDCDVGGSSRMAHIHTNMLSCGPQPLRRPCGPAANGVFRSISRWTSSKLQPSWRECRSRERVRAIQSHYHGNCEATGHSVSWLTVGGRSHGSCGGKTERKMKSSTLMLFREPTTACNRRPAAPIRCHFILNARRQSRLAATSVPLVQTLP